MTTTPTYAEQRDEVSADLAQQVPAELLEGFGRIIADQTAVDYAGRAPKEGDPAPDFMLPDQLGRQVSLAGELKQGPVALIFYRGEWCPYCNAMLRTYGLRAAEFTKRGARPVAVSPQTPDHSLTMAEKHSLKFPVLSDEGGEVLGAYGLKYDITSRELYETAGVDLAKYNGDSAWILPAPAVFVVDREGHVRFAYVNGDYTQPRSQTRCSLHSTRSRAETHPRRRKRSPERAYNHQRRTRCMQLPTRTVRYGLGKSSRYWNSPRPRVGA